MFISNRIRVSTYPLRRQLYVRQGPSTLCAVSGSHCDSVYCAATFRPSFRLYFSRVAQIFRHVTSKSTMILISTLVLITKMTLVSRSTLTLTSYSISNMKLNMMLMLMLNLILKKISLKILHIITIENHFHYQTSSMRCK